MRRMASDLGGERDRRRVFGPVLRDNLLVTVRPHPSGVAFLDSHGPALEPLALPALSEATGNPAVSGMNRRADRRHTRQPDPH